MDRRPPAGSLYSLVLLVAAGAVASHGFRHPRLQSHKKASLFWEGTAQRATSPALRPPLSHYSRVGWPAQDAGAALRPFVASGLSNHLFGWAKFFQAWVTVHRLTQAGIVPAVSLTVHRCGAVAVRFVTPQVRWRTLPAQGRARPATIAEAAGRNWRRRSHRQRHRAALRHRKPLLPRPPPRPHPPG